MSVICPHCQSSFEDSPEEIALRQELAPVIGGKQFALPPPGICPLCRHRRRISFRNERKLYRTSCVVSKRSIVSSYSPDKPIKVVDRPVWLEQDNRQFGRDYDFSRPFFEQFEDLCRDTYKANVAQAGEIYNSEYTHSVGWLKNCYLIFDSGKDEDCAYGSFLAYSKNCFDVTFGFYCELCYDGVKLENCYAVISSDYCKNCSFSAFLHDCIGCKFCIGCVNLRNQEYCVFNEFVGKEQYEKIWAQYFCGKSDALAEFRTKFQELLSRSPRRAAYIMDSADSTGDSLLKCQNVTNSFEVLEANNCANLFDIFRATEKTLDVTGFGEGMEFCYDSTQCGGTLGKSAVSNIYFSAHVFYGGYNVLYCSNCHENCQSLFGCADLRKGEYCILNKQYSQAEYEALVPRIIEHMQQTREWGEFFPLWLSPYGYNETLAYEEFPLEKAQAQRIGANWSDYVPPPPEVAEIIKAADLPRNLSEVTDAVLKSAICCEESGRPFRVIRSELEFLRRFNLSLPRKHPELRERDRRLRKNGRRLYKRACSRCALMVDSVVPPTHTGPALCERCYQESTYGAAASSN